MKIGVQLYTLRGLLKNEKDIRTTLSRIKDIGYNYVQLSGVGRIDETKARLFN